MKLLNLGCGHHYHTEWINVDFTKTGENVIAHNLLKGIPFDANCADAIYHSHLFEHFHKEDAVLFLKECYRVLKPDGIIRIVVPDLEKIVSEYLTHLEKSLAGDKMAQYNYEWIMLEMYDQVVRNQRGGEMLQYLQNTEMPNKEYIYKRIGLEVKEIGHPNPSQQTFVFKKNMFIRLSDFLSRFKIKLAKIILGNNAHFIDIGQFRTLGENHLWMYDRYSLTKLLIDCGFYNVKISNAFHSTIPEWHKYNLDVFNGEVRQPSSLFVEARK